MTRSMRTPTWAVVLSLVALAGCGRTDAETPDSPIAGMGQAARPAPAESAVPARHGLAQAAAVAGDQVADAVITTSVNGRLAKDRDLSALRIDVDSNAGHVSLHGVAPDAASRTKATQLAATVKGVHSVDNQLQLAADRK